MNAAYQPRRAAQIAAFFALKEGGRINVLKLAKLLYLAERRYLERFDEPMTYDRLVSMDHGPVTSITLNLINGNLEDAQWSEFMTDRARYEVGLARDDLAFGDFDQLSRADVNVLEEIWGEFGGMERFEIRDYTHRACPEWEDPDGSSLPIPYERVLKFLGKENVPEIVEEINAWRQTQRAIAACS